MMLTLLACSEFVIEEGDPVAPAQPPGPEEGPEGVPPDWTSCTEGYAGRYYNLPDDHPDVGREGAVDLSGADWWDAGYLSFERFEPSLELGADWWPLDEDLSGDPLYFAVTWYAWLRIEAAGAKTVVGGAATDLEVRIGEEVVIERTGQDDLEISTWNVDLDAGVEPLRVRFAHRLGATDGLRFRVTDADVQLCYPAWE